MKLIVGLGNPGAEYARTRHNVGFEVLDELSKRHGISLSKRNYKALYGEGTVNGQRTLLVKPLTYMNLSGEAVGGLARFFKIESDEIILILDDVALPIGKLRLRLKGSAGGHNGLAHILQVFGTQDIPRIRIGVGASRPGSLIEHVLSRFGKEELPLMQEAYGTAADAVEYALREGFEAAMNRFNLPA